MFFLSALGAGGLSVSFFMLLMFLVPHKGVPIPHFDLLFPKLIEGNMLSFIIIIALLGILFFGFYFFKLLIWNVLQYKKFKNTEAYTILKTTNAEVSLMAVPLTFAMMMNVGFIFAAVFIPRLWGVVEYLFPFALLGFAIIGYFAIQIFMEYWGRILIKGDFDEEKNNNLSQMISVFAFAMIGVGFAAPGAMSHHLIINTFGIIGSIFFLSLALVFLLIKFFMGFKSMLRNGINTENSPSLWIIIPFLTLFGISIVRIHFGLEHHFGAEKNDLFLLIFTTLVLSLQIVFGMLGYKVMRANQYFKTFIHSEKKSVGAFALICPGVAAVVFGWFFINYGLVLNGIIPSFQEDPFLYTVFLAPFLFIQIQTIRYYLILKKKFFGEDN